MLGARLPAGRHFAVTWSIPDDFGGMTIALLHRSRAFVRLGGARVDILTFDARPDYPRIEARLRQRGAMVDGMRLLNLYDWLRIHPLPGGSLQLDRDDFAPIAADADVVAASRDGVVLSRTRFAIDGQSVLQRDHFREDGTLLLSDRRIPQDDGTPGERSVVLCDERGRPVRSWRRVWPLYRAWLDAVSARRPSWFVVDSKTSADFMLGYRRRNAVVIHVVHNSHLADPDRPDGPLRESRRRAIEGIDSFDSVVVLTERQRADLEVARGPLPNLVVIPNAREPDRADGPSSPARTDARRDPTAGIVIASLTGRKQVDHALRGAAGAELPHLTLDVYGEGPRRAELERIAGEVADRVEARFHGYRPDARERLRSASFLLATGRSEGFPLVLLEAMAAGCLPIAYDVRYGPSDLIRDGIDGRLVPAGDIAALSRAIEQLARTSPARQRRMRRAARRTVRAYRDGPITRRWARELRAARRRHRATGVLPREDARTAAPA
jgi:poly(glycerol-phosphate) alpha-glucosyltransferase